MEGVAAVGLGAGGAPGGAAVAAADEEVTGGQCGGVEAAECRAYLAGCRVDAVFGAVAGQAYGVGAAAQAGELSREGGQGAALCEGGQFGERGGVVAGDDGCLLFGFVEKGQAAGAADAWRYRAAPAAVQRW
ncbi:hypothetical protein GCM10009802_09930 [Streptomyces synnematoformans]|uniref:Uncharacterized protein n=1 Tax=Streptomyces synnematoformans TaxID=415721 RepID=A0ABN2XKL8_9ACTN